MAAPSVAFSDTTSQTSGGAEVTLGNSGAAITTAGVYMLELDTSLMDYGTTADIIEVTPYVKRTSGGSEVKWGPTISLFGKQSAAFSSFPVPSIGSIRFGVKQPQGTTRAMPWSIWLCA